MRLKRYLALLPIALVVAGLAFGSTAGGARTAKAPQRDSGLVNRNLVVKLAGSGKGSVKSNPAGISCGAKCKHAFAQGTALKLTAIPAKGSVFTGWTANCAVKTNRQKAYQSSTCSITMGKNRVAVAKFKANHKSDKKKHKKKKKKKHKKH